MSAPFDPYYTWLGISPAEQPADYYRLLGVQRFESNADAIQSAMDQRMHFLRTLQVGPRSALSQSLLNEIAFVGACLLDPADKAEYDRKLRFELVERDVAQRVATPVIPVLQVAPTVEPGPTVAVGPFVVPATLHAPSPSRFAGFDWQSNWGLAIIAVVALPVLGLAGIGIARWGGSNREPVAKVQPGIQRDAPSTSTSNSSGIPPGKIDARPINPTAGQASLPGTTSVAVAAGSSDDEAAAPTKPDASPMPNVPPPFFVAGKPVNLLKPADGKFRVLRGGVTHGSGEVRTQPTSTAFAIPVKWPEEYAIEAEVKRLTGKNSLCLGFLVQGRPLTAIIDGFDSQRSGLARIGGFEIFAHESPFAKNGALLVNGVESTVRIEVTRQSVVLAVDDQLVSQWNIDPQLPISAAQGMNWLENEALCVYTWDASYHFKRLELLPLMKDE